MLSFSKASVFNYAGSRKTGIWMPAPISIKLGICLKFINRFDPVFIPGKACILGILLQEMENTGSTLLNSQGLALHLCKADVLGCLSGDAVINSNFSDLQLFSSIEKS
jgi:hypothetical protein